MNKDNVKLAIAPIGWTNDDMPELGSENTFQQIVSEMALAGFTGSEVGSKYCATANQQRKLCGSFFATSARNLTNHQPTQKCRCLYCNGIF